jgi:hypothetical protein
MEPYQPGWKFDVKSADPNSVKLVTAPGRSRSRPYLIMIIGLFPMLVASGVIKGGLPEVPRLVIASLGLPFILAGLISLSIGPPPLSVRSKVLMFLWICSTIPPLGWFALFSTAPIEFRVACGLPFVLLLLFMLWRYRNKNEEKEWHRDRLPNPIEAQAPSQAPRETLLARFENDKKSSTWFGTTADNGVQLCVFAATVTGLTALVFISWGLVKMAGWHEMSTWPSTSATVSSTYVERCFIKERSNQVLFRPRLKYAYTVKNKAYTGDDLICAAFDDPADASKELPKYSNGSQIDIRYNPTRLEKSKWNLHEVCTEALGLIVTGVATFIVAGFCALLAWFARATVIRTQNRQSSDANSAVQSKSRWRSGQ